LPRCDAPRWNQYTTIHAFAFYNSPIKIQLTRKSKIREIILMAAKRMASHVMVQPRTHCFFPHGISDRANKPSAAQFPLSGLGTTHRLDGFCPRQDAAPISHENLVNIPITHLLPAAAKLTTYKNANARRLLPSGKRWMLVSPLM